MTTVYYILFCVGAISIIFFIFSNLIDFLQKIKITGCELLPSYSKYLIEKDKLIIPKDTKKINLCGEYNFVLSNQNFISFVRKENIYFPQQWIWFNSNKKWECEITFGEGLDTTDYTSIIIAKVSPEFKKLIDHYWYVGKKTKQWIGIKDDYFDKIIQEIEIKIS